MIAISVETVCYIISAARALSLGSDSDDGDHAPDAHGHEDLVHGDVDDDDEFLDDEEYDDDDEDETSEEEDELQEFIDNLNEDEQIELVALSWVGRGTYTVDEWDDATETARSEHTLHTGEYLLGQPMIADYLEEGLSQLGYSCEE